MIKQTTSYQISLSKYFSTIFNTLIKPDKAFETFDIPNIELISFLMLSAWIYAIIANYLRELSPFLLLLFAPASVLIHAFLLGTFCYLIFGKLFGARTDLKECFRISSYILLALLPFISIVFIGIRDNMFLLTIKMLPFVYYIVLTYRATRIRFKELTINKLIRGNVLYNLATFLISTVVFTLNIWLIIILNNIFWGLNYQWHINYN